MPKMCAKPTSPRWRWWPILKQRANAGRQLVVWSGGVRSHAVEHRTSAARNRSRNTDANISPEKLFGAWMDGGGVARRSLTFGTTDDYGYQVVKTRVHLQ